MIIRGLDTGVKERTSKVFLHIGAKKTGKTQGTLSTCVDMWRNQGKPVLVLDRNGQPEYDIFRPIDLDDIADWESIWRGVRQPFFRCRTIDIDLFFACVHEYIINSFVVFEDSTAYMSGNLNDVKENLILNSRNVSNDYFFNLHSLAEPAPFLYRHSEVLILRKTGDDADHLPSKIPLRHKVRGLITEIDRENKTRYRDTEYKLAWRKLDLTEF